MADDQIPRLVETTELGINAQLLELWNIIVWYTSRPTLLGQKNLFRLSSGCHGHVVFQPFEDRPVA